MKFISIDQSYNSTGFCVFDNGELVRHGLFRSSKALDIYDRAKQITHEIITLANSHNINDIIIEGLAFSKMGNATRDLAGLQFVIIYAARMKGLNVTIIPPLRVKKLATGKGRATKDDMLNSLPDEVLALFSLSAKKSTGLYDLADAYWIGATHKAADLV